MIYWWKITKTYKSFKEATEKEENIPIIRIKKTLFIVNYKIKNIIGKPAKRLLKLIRFPEYKRKRKHIWKSCETDTTTIIDRELLKDLWCPTAATDAMGFRSVNSIKQVCGNMNRLSGGDRWRYADADGVAFHESGSVCQYTMEGLLCKAI